MTVPYKPDDLRLRFLWKLVLFASGALTVLAFAPFNLWGLPPFTLALLFIHWNRYRELRGQAGFIFGLGLFLAGVHWIYISLHDHGGMPAPIAALALFGFSGFIALMPALAGLASRVLPSHPRDLWITFPALWTLLEWTRTWFCTGFPWLAVGYSQVPGSPLVGLIPILGVYGASLGVSLIAGALAFALIHREWKRPAVLIVCLLLLGTGLSRLHFVSPLPGPLAVTLVQGNIPQDDKFDPAHLREGMERYLDLTEASHDPLIVLPESAIPLLLSDTPEGYLKHLEKIGLRNHGDVLVGVFNDAEPTAIHNSMLSLGVSPRQHYFKHHLVPFGEFIPWESVVSPVMDALLNMPIGSQAAGPLGQGVFKVAGSKAAMDICYEDAFGEEIITALPEAEFLINVSNDAWFGYPFGPEQHLQMAATRALETGREMARVTNTGVTAFIDAEGRIKARAPTDQAVILRGTVQRYEGSTPFVRWANTPLVLLCIAGLLFSWIGSRRVSR